MAKAHLCQILAALAGDQSEIHRQAEPRRHCLCCISNRPVLLQLQTFAHHDSFRRAGTHAYKSSLKAYTLFSGLVSRAALAHIEDGTYKGHTIVREHHRKMQRSLTAYIQERMDGAPWNYTEFEERVKHLSEVHITSVAENAALNRKGATYINLGIELVNWTSSLLHSAHCCISTFWLDT